MATGSYPAATSPATAERERYIERQINATRRQVKFVEIGVGLVSLVVGVLAYFFIMALVDHWLMPLGHWGRAAALATLVIGAIWYAAMVLWPLLRNSINPAYAALTIENSTPTLKNSLINFLMLRSQRGGVHDVVYEAVEARAANDLKQVSLDAVIDYSKLIKIGYVLAGLFAVLAAYKILSPKDPLQTVARVAAPWADIAQPSRVQIEEVTPGDAEKFFGDTVEISALVRGARPSDRLELVYSTVDGQIVDKAVPLVLDASGLKYVAQLPVDGQGLQQDLTYRLAAGDALTRDYKLHVLASPTIVVEKLTYDFPRYTQKPQQMAERIGDIRALEGTKVTISAKANQPISAAYVEFDPGQVDDSPAGALKRQRLPMTADGHDATALLVLELSGDRATPKFGSYQITFMTSGGFPGKNPALHTIDIVRDLPPEVEILTPVEQLTTVPVNGQQVVEVRAVDADFALARVSLKITHGAHDLAEEILLSSATGQQGQWVGKFKFRPQEYKLQPGDEVVLWAVAADNRTSAKSSVAEPNVERTKNYIFKIGAPNAQAEAEKNQADQEQDPMPGEQEGAEDNKQPKQDDQPKQPGKEDENKEGENKEGENGTEQSEAGGQASDKKNKKSDKPDKSKSEQNQQNSEAGGSEKNKDDEGGKPDKPSTGGGQNGEGQQEKKNDAKQNGNKSKQPGGKEGEGESKPQPGEQNQKKNKKNGGAGKEGDEQQPNQPNGAKPDKQPPGAGKGSDKNDEATKPEEQSDAGATNGQAGSEAGKSQTPMTGGSGKSDNNEKSKNGGMGQGSEAGGNAQGAGSQQSPPGKKNDQPAGGSKEGQPQGAEQGQKAEGNAGGQTSKQKGSRGEKSQSRDKLPEGPKEKAHEGEAVEKALERLLEQAKNQQEAGGAEGAQPQPGAEKPGAEKLDDDLAKKAKEFLDKQKQQQEGKAGGEQTDKPSGKSEAGEQPGKSSKPSGADKKQGSGANNERGQGETGKPDETAKPKPEEKGGDDAKTEKKSDGGMGTNGQSGSGRESQDKTGAAQAQETNKDTPKEAKPDNQKSPDGKEPQSPSGSKKQSNSQGGEGGDRSGGGKKGGGQSANAAGSDAAGSNNSADEGAGASTEKGMGETGSKGGDQQKSNKPTGQSGGKEKGPGSKTQQDPAGDQKGSGETTSEDGMQPMEKPEKPDGSFTGAKAGAKGPVTGGGLPSDEQSSDNSQDDAQAPAAEKAKIDYARQATDLVLEYLKDQKEQPNQELLDELGWTKEDLNQFLSRWESAKREASTNPKSKGELDEALRSLGLRPQGDKLRKGEVKSDNVRGLGDVGSQSGPPSKYAEQFRAFKKGAARGK